MNERMAELYRQAQVPYTAIDPSNNMPYETTCFSADTFAELIVKECASICELNGQTYKYSFTPAKARLAEYASNYCAMMINKHFGTEE
jgi:hypothetical protein